MNIVSSAGCRDSPVPVDGHHPIMNANYPCCRRQFEDSSAVYAHRPVEELAGGAARSPPKPEVDA